MSLVLNLSMLGKNPTGLGVYAAHCASALSERFGVKLIAGGSKLPAGEVIATAPENTAIGGGRLAPIRRQLWMRRLRMDADALVYSPTHHGLPSHSDQIITVHDLICLRYPDQHKPQYLFFKYALPRLMRASKAVFTVSETTKADIQRTYGYPAENIHVVPNGVDRGVFACKIPSESFEPYILMVGARYAHKNVQEVLEQCATWRRKYKLRVTSCGGPYRKALEARVAELGLEQDVIFEDYLSMDELIARYQNAAALVYPSKWEGFGIPPLESLSAGTPVIASDIPVHREVLGDAAIYVTLGSAVSWKEAFERLDSRADVSQLMIAADRVLERFTWRASADQLELNLLKVAPALEACRRSDAVSVCEEVR